MNAIKHDADISKTPKGCIFAYLVYFEDLGFAKVYY
ncbi:hypothetical protein Pan153_24010 [Gimesia panareensis]|uniref:Uncharacterized protein n=1 Tax=Gimesia panareensis TaxID=2527978 RepID=A0A518FN09_9PLAN|nr:hypothetical protein Pan153_24010 [Gimesia panareensis]